MVNLELDLQPQNVTLGPPTVRTAIDKKTGYRNETRGLYCLTHKSLPGA